MANWFTNPASNTMLDNSFRNQFFQNQVRPVQTGATNIRPTNLQALKNWTPWKAVMPKSWGGTWHTGGTPQALSALGYGTAAALPFGMAGLTHMVQKGLPEELKGEGGLFNTSTAAWGGMGAGAGIEPETDEILRANAIFSGNEPIEEQVTEETAPHVFDPGVAHSGMAEGIKDPNLFQRIGQALGMTQVSDADRAANEQFMQDQGIYRDPTTGRMIGGDFAGKNAPGTSGWGSANFDEMRGKWVDKYGEMDYTTKKMKDKRDRLVKEEADYQAKLRADKIAADAAGKTITGGKTTTGDRPSYGGPPASFFDPKQSHNAPTHMGAGPLHGVQQGGYMRSRYNQGGRVGILSVF